MRVCVWSLCVSGSQGNKFKDMHSLQRFAFSYCAWVDSQDDNDRLKNKILTMLCWPSLRLGLRLSPRVFFSCSSSNLVWKIKRQTLLQIDECALQKQLLELIDSFIAVTLKGRCSNPSCTWRSYLRNATKVVICRQKRKLYILCTCWGSSSNGMIYHQ